MHKLVDVSLTINENSSMVEQYQCLVEECIIQEEQNTCTNTNYYHMIIPDVTNRRIVQRPNVFYHQWHKLSSTVELQVTDDQLDCDGVKFHWLLEHDNQGQLIVYYIPSVTMVHNYIYVRIRGLRFENTYKDKSTYSNRTVNYIKVVRSRITS